ncbi:hypothetical protein J4206_03455 [Candidatus Woesearchaeota archaeon]|nr:hypothetical protein [Candidatus Woesearchaeota archaeon]
MTSTAPPTAQERTIEEIVQLWRNAEFVELRDSALKPALERMPETAEQRYKGIAASLASGNLTELTTASNIYNSINSFDNAVAIFERTVPEDKRTLDLFGRFYKTVSDEDNYIGGVSQLRDDQLRRTLLLFMVSHAKTRSSEPYRLDVSFMQSTGMPLGLVAAANTHSYYDAIPKLLELSGAIRAGYESLARYAKGHPSMNDRDVIKMPYLRAEAYRSVFGSFQKAIEFIDAEHYFKMFLEIIQGKLDGVAQDPRMKLAQSMYAYKIMKIAEYFNNPKE